MAQSKVLTRLRELMKNGDSLDAYVIDNQDAHHDEYISKVDNRISVISGFPPRHSTTVITTHKAALWTDCRFLQEAEKRLDPKIWTIFLQGHPDTPSREEYLLKELAPNSRVGVNPLYISYRTWKHLKTELSAGGHTLVSVKYDLVDVIREEESLPTKPTPAKGELFVLDLKYSGKSWQDKVLDLREQLKRRFAYAFVVSKLDELAWLFNIRGDDIPHNPVFYGYAIVTLDSICIFMDENKLTEEVRVHLGMKNGNLDDTMKVQVSPIDNITSAISDLAKLDKRIWMSTDVVATLGMLVAEVKLLIEMSPVACRKVVKNPVEVQGMKNCHIRDGVALCDYWSWLDQEVPTGKVTTVAAADKLEEYCRQQVDFIDNCFGTQSYIGDGDMENTHSPETGKIITGKGMYLCASGRHYRDGTTNITRVMHYGTPTEWEKECYTRILMGHIDCAATVFPRGTTGHAVDAISRRALWHAGLEWMVFTGHGVGHVLSVMEDHYGIVNKAFHQEIPLTDGMCLTIEPAYYEDESYGVRKFSIRLENLFIIRPVQLKKNHKNIGFLKFEVVSFVPFARNMLMMSLMTKAQIDWLNAYHAQCLEVLTPVLKEQGRTRAIDWLERETRPLEMN